MNHAAQAQSRKFGNLGGDQALEGAIEGILPGHARPGAKSKRKGPGAFVAPGAPCANATAEGRSRLLAKAQPSWSQAGLLASGSSFRRAFPPGQRARTVVHLRRSSPVTAARPRPSFTAFPLGPFGTCNDHPCKVNQRGCQGEHRPNCRKKCGWVDAACTARDKQGGHGVWTSRAVRAAASDSAATWSMRPARRKPAAR